MGKNPQFRHYYVSVYISNIRRFKKLKNLQLEAVLILNLVNM